MLKTVIAGLGLALACAGVWAKDVVIDVRTPKEFAADHIEGAINIEHTNIAEAIAKAGVGKDDKVILYCQSGRRSGIAIVRLARPASGGPVLERMLGAETLWRGDFLPDFPYEPWAEDTRRDLDRERVSLLERLAAALAEMGRPAAAIERYRRLIETDPEREGWDGPRSGPEGETDHDRAAQTVAAG